MVNKWYDVVDQTQYISQGDILIDFPLLVPRYPVEDVGDFDFNAFDHKSTVEIYRTDVIVMNQSCDLEVREGSTEPKLDLILLAELEDASSLGRPKLENLAKLKVNEGYLLEPSYQDIPMSFKIVRFNSPVTSPWKIINQFTRSQGLRLRLKSPYLEDMSQHFGKYFSRVAIPEDRSHSIDKYLHARSLYDEQRKATNSSKMWESLSAEEMAEFIKKCGYESL
ncbi:MAG: hypothetical protein ABS938_00310 [Psychrobacillus psychrodurans]